MRLYASTPGGHIVATVVMIRQGSPGHWLQSKNAGRWPALLLCSQCPGFDAAGSDPRGLPDIGTDSEAEARGLGSAGEARAALDAGAGFGTCEVAQLDGAGHRQGSSADDVAP